MNDVQLGAPGFDQEVLSDLGDEESEDFVGADKFGEFFEVLQMYGL